MKKMYWYNGGFYDRPMDGGTEISVGYWQELLDGQAAGKIIVSDENDYPILAEPRPSLDGTRKMVLARIRAYDTSNAVNSFTLNGTAMWLDKAARASLARTLEILEASGADSVTVWSDGMPPVPVELSIENARTLLNAVELYAKECMNVTQTHIRAIFDTNDTDEVLLYDYTAGYPEKLTLKFA